MAKRKPRAFSYIRFSSAKQAEGDSLRRQTEAAREYAERHGLELADLTFRDLGVSAFRGKNAAEGALAEFVKAIDAGKVKPGDYLLVESLDRLSRKRIKAALDQFSDLLAKEVRVVTLSDGKVYTSESLDNLQDLMWFLMIASRANEESETKAKRGRAAWKNKKERAREVGEIMTSSVPAWLRARVDASGRRTAEVDARKAKVVRRIFEMAAEGWGTQRIARQLNDDKVTVFGRSDGWRESYIRLILKNAAVIGQFQPMKNTEAGERIPDGDPREGYFPAVVEPALFYKVKHTRAGPSGVANKRGDDLPRNLLAGLVFCAKCGGARHYVSKGRNNVYLDCDNRRRKGTCDAPAVRYRDVFAGVMEQLQDIRPIEGNDHAARERDLEIDKLDGEVAEAREAVEALLENMTRSTSPRLADFLDAKEAALATMEARREELRAEAKAAAEKQVAATVSWPATGTIYEQIDGADQVWIDAGKGSDPNSDRTLVYHIIAEVRRLVERVEVVKGEPIKIIPKG